MRRVVSMSTTAQTEPLSKRTRFDIFARDNFTCQYCGQKPPQVVLEIDHIEPRSRGGSNDDLNLVTSCFDCNRGKGAKVLKALIERPDADVKYLWAAQELAEARRFIRIKKKLDAAQNVVISVLQRHWIANLNTSEKAPSANIVRQWLTYYSPEEIVRAINLAIPRVNGRPDEFPRFDNNVRYVSGILRNHKGELENRTA
jgi:hypothetical protein